MSRAQPRKLRVCRHGFILVFGPLFPVGKAVPSHSSGFDVWNPRLFRCRGRNFRPAFSSCPRSSLHGNGWQRSSSYLFETNGARLSSANSHPSTSDPNSRLLADFFADLANSASLLPSLRTLIIHHSCTISCIIHGSPSFVRFRPATSNSGLWEAASINL
ncbi:hypothetical protein C8R45DRAFT_388637 [Mycena sanguinolenta]|nr:hypothetical protein C8R45DRAFT_388637 [Mycena sanguinolenta]